MCEFVSWKEIVKNGEVIEIKFITKHDLATKEGKALLKYLGSKFAEDVKGHGAISHYFNIPDGFGRNKECTDFSSPKNFPPVIVQAIKQGDFENIGICADILTRKAFADYSAKRDALYADYMAKRGVLDADYRAKCDPLNADYRAKCDPLNADYEKQEAIYADYRAKCDPLNADYRAKRDALYADYMAKRDALFWGIATDPNNRRKEWR